MYDVSAYHDLELALHFLNFILGLDEVLAVQIPVCTHRLVQILLLLQPCLSLYNLHHARLSAACTHGRSASMNTCACMHPWKLLLWL